MRVQDFLKQLSTDPSMMKAYTADPSAAMTKSGIVEADQIAVLSGDRSKLSRAMGAEPAGIKVRVIVLIELQ